MNRTPVRSSAVPAALTPSAALTLSPASPGGVRQQLASAGSTRQQSASHDNTRQPPPSSPHSAVDGTGAAATATTATATAITTATAPGYAELLARIDQLESTLHQLNGQLADYQQYSHSADEAAARATALSAQLTRERSRNASLDMELQDEYVRGLTDRKKIAFLLDVIDRLNQRPRHDSSGNYNGGDHNEGDGYDDNDSGTGAGKYINDAAYSGRDNDGYNENGNDDATKNGNHGNHASGYASGYASGSISGYAHRRRPVPPTSLDDNVEVLRVRNEALEAKLRTLQKHNDALSIALKHEQMRADGEAAHRQDSEAAMADMRASIAKLELQNSAAVRQIVQLKRQLHPSSARTAAPPAALDAPLAAPGTPPALSLGSGRLSARQQQHHHHHSSSAAPSAVELTRLHTELRDARNQLEAAAEHATAQSAALTADNARLRKAMASLRRRVLFETEGAVTDCLVAKKHVDRIERLALLVQGIDATQALVQIQGAADKIMDAVQCIAVVRKQVHED